MWYPRHWSSHAVGLVATVLLHSVLFLSISLGSVAASKRAPEELGPGASEIVSSEGSWMTLVLVNLPGPNDAPMAEDIASRGAALSHSIIQIVSPDPTPSVEMPEPAFVDESGEAAYTAGDPVRQSMLFGRYTGQIDARIQRAWRKPRSAINEPVASSNDLDHAVGVDTFRCQARIVQEVSGHVKEVELMQCNGSPAWQLSLVRAIQLASPLPAPPDPSVFTNALTLTFEGKAYEPGYRDDEYEPAPSSPQVGVAYYSSPPALREPDQIE